MGTIKDKAIFLNVVLGEDFTYERMKELEKEFICTDCDSALAIWQDAAINKLRLTCARDHEHRGFSPPPLSEAERYRRGEGGSAITKMREDDRLKKRGLTGGQISTVNGWQNYSEDHLADVLMKLYPSPKKLNGEIDERFGIPTKAAAILLAHVALATKLNPFDREIIMFQGVPFETARGTYKRAQANGEFLRVTSEKADDKEYTDRNIAKDAFMWKADVFTKRSPDKPAFTRFAVVTKDEWRGANQYTHLAKDPADMAQKRAEARVLRAVAGEIQAKSIDDIPEAETIEAEWKVKTPAEIAQVSEKREEAPTPPKDSAPTPEPVKGPPAPPETPLEKMLRVCPEHDEVWIAGQYDKSHRLQGNGFCNRGTVVRPYMKAELDRVCQAMIVSVNSVNEFCKERFTDANNKGKTWSALSPEQQYQVIQMIAEGAIASPAAQ